MFCEESLGKIKFRAFPKRVGPRILSLEIAMVGCYKFNCIQMSLVMSMRSIFGDDSFSVIETLEFSFIYTRV